MKAALDGSSNSVAMFSRILHSGDVHQKLFGMLLDDLRGLPEDFDKYLGIAAPNVDGFGPLVADMLSTETVELQ